MTSENLRCPRCSGPAVRILQTGAIHCANQCEETDPARVARLELQHLTADVARLLGPALPKGVGFILVLADFGSDGGMAYASSIDREDTTSMMQELVDKMRHDEAVSDHIVNTTVAKAVAKETP